MIPASVEPCFDTVRKTSPGRPSSYSPIVAKPLQSATRNSNVRPVRLRGSFSRTGRWTTFSTIALDDLRRRWPRLAAAFFAVDSGWPTLQLSR